MITRPSSGMTMKGAGLYEISGLAWSGAGRIRGSKCRLDGGATLARCRAAGAALPKSLVRFRLPWEWNGNRRSLQSRATDEKGDVQPTRKAYKAQNAVDRRFHNNTIVTWASEQTGASKMFTFKPLAVSIAVAALLAACATQATDTAVPRAVRTSAAGFAGGDPRWDISIPPSGAGLPARQRHASRRAGLRREMPGVSRRKRRGQARRSARGRGRHARYTKPLRTVGSYWPYATTLFDYMRRAMPIRTRSRSQRRGVRGVAYVLLMNGIIGEDAVMNAQTLPP